MKLIEALLLGLSESLKLLKEKCSVRVNLLSNNVIRALMKKKANISDKIINSALEQVNKHNIEFIIVKEDDKNRIILDRVKRKSKEILSNKKRISNLLNMLIMDIIQDQKKWLYINIKIV